MLIASALADGPGIGNPIGGILGLVVAIACAIGCNRIAVGKGRGPVLWAILGLFFTIIALIIIAVLPRKGNAPV